MKGWESYATLNLERAKFEFDLVRNALSTGDTIQARERLLFLAELGVIRTEAAQMKVPGRPLPSFADTDPIAGLPTDNPAFNALPVSFSPRAAHDLLVIDGFVLNGTGRDGRYSQTFLEHSDGLHVNAGDRIVVSLYFRNDAQYPSNPTYSSATEVRIGIPLIRLSANSYIVGGAIFSNNSRAVYSSDVGKGDNLHVTALYPIKLVPVPRSVGVCLAAPRPPQLPPYDRQIMTERCTEQPDMRFSFPIPGDPNGDAGIEIGTVGPGVQGLVYFTVEVAKA